jgi:hypothetical protein
MQHSNQRLGVNHSSVTAKVIDGEAIILDVTRGAYYSMDGAGAVIWELLAEGRSRSEIADLLVRHYGATPDRVAPEVERILEELLSEQLVVPLPDGKESPTERPELPAPNGPFQPPQLFKHSDMAELLALDPPTPMPLLEEILDDGS